MALSDAPRGRRGDQQAELGGGAGGERSRLGHERQFLTQVCVEPIAFVPRQPVAGQGWSVVEGHDLVRVGRVPIEGPDHFARWQLQCGRNHPGCACTAARMSLLPRSSSCWKIAVETWPTSVSRLDVARHDVVSRNGELGAQDRQRNRCNDRDPELARQRHGIPGLAPSLAQAHGHGWGRCVPWHRRGLRPGFHARAAPSRSTAAACDTMTRCAEE